MMKYILMFLFAFQFASAQEVSVVRLSTPSPVVTEGGWKQLTSVLHSSTDYTRARQFCEDSATTLQLLGTDEVVFQASCQFSLDSQCTYSNCFELKARVLFVGK